MNILFNKIFSKLSTVVSVRLLIALTKQKLICPFYHAISDNELIHIKHLYKVRNQKEFERDLDFFLKYFRPIDYLLLIDRLKQERKIYENSFLLSFDDGLREFHDVIAPVLLKKGVPAICFLNSSFIDNKDLFFKYKESILVEKISKIQQTKTINNELKSFLKAKNISADGNIYDILKIKYSNSSSLNELATFVNFDFNDYLKQQKPYLTSEQIMNLKQKGFHFGAHSIDHPLFSELTLDDQIKQTQESVDLISNTFKLDYKLFSFPFTDYLVTMLYFETIFDPQNPISDLTFGCAGLKHDSVRFNIQRIPMEISNFLAKDIISSEYIYYILKSLINRNVIKRY